jgi:hypothetical protein
VKTLTKYTSEHLAKQWLREGEDIIELTPRFGKWPHVMVAAKIDTGADRTSVHEDLCIALGWEIVGSTVIRNANGRKVRNTYLARFTFADIDFVVEVTASDRSKVSHPVLIGRDVLRDTIESLEEE